MVILFLVSRRDRKLLTSILFCLIVKSIVIQSSEQQENNSTLNNKHIAILDKPIKHPSDSTRLGNVLLFKNSLEELKKQLPVGRENIELSGDNNNVMSKRDVINRLSSEFSQLFDELWKINNSSIIVLTGLNIDQNNVNVEQEQETKVAWTDSLVSETSTSSTSNISSSSDIPDQPIIEPEVNDQSKTAETNKTSENDESSKVVLVDHPNNHHRPIYSYQHIVKPGSNLNKQQQQLNLGAQFKIWVLSIQLKIRNFLHMLSRPFVTRFVPVRNSSNNINNNRLHSTTVKGLLENREVNEQNREPSLKSLDQGLNDDQVRQMEKRHVREDETTIDRGANNTSNSMRSESCIPLDSNKLEKCRDIEVNLNLNLNNSFPGTQAAVEENCRHISYALANCWLKHLQYMKNLVTSSWDESLVSKTDFPLPTPAAAAVGARSSDENSDTRISCGTSPREALPIIDRINWMWLNLCMDKKFRLDYVENIKCLSAWTQERAQRTCSVEYKRMQDFFLGLSQRESLAVETRRISTAKAAASSNGTSTITQQTSQGMLAEEKDLDSKTHCCVFDMFLRCIHRQSLRDCGRAGSQFVVNFMGRIGTDDMKYLCKKELKSMQRGRQQTSVKRNDIENNDRHPFIESIHCADRRIQSVLYGTKNEDKVRFPGASVTPRTTASHNDHRASSSAGYESNSSLDVMSSLKSTDFLILWILIVINLRFVLDLSL